MGPWKLGPVPAEFSAATASNAVSAAKPSKDNEQRKNGFMAVLNNKPEGMGSRQSHDYWKDQDTAAGKVSLKTGPALTVFRFARGPTECELPHPKEGAPRTFYAHCA